MKNKIALVFLKHLKLNDPKSNVWNIIKISKMCDDMIKEINKQPTQKTVMSKNDDFIHHYSNIWINYTIQKDVVCIEYEDKTNSDIKGSVESYDLEDALKMLVSDVIEKTTWYL